jgi:hypothetical protein
MMPIQVISRPDAHQERIVISDFNALDLFINCKLVMVAR